MELLEQAVVVVLGVELAEPERQHLDLAVEIPAIMLMATVVAVAVALEVLAVMGMDFLVVVVALV
jgi:hypothetical protein